MKPTYKKTPTKPTQKRSPAPQAAKAHKPVAGGGNKSYAHLPKQKWLYGTHAVEAAIGNPERTGLTLIYTQNQAEFASNIKRSDVQKQMMSGEDLAALLPDGAVHQGLALWTKPLPAPDIKQALYYDGAVVVFDQITDQHNVGAILRSCAAFGVEHVIMQDRHAPEITGALAKSACGALEKVSIHLVTNISQSLEQFKKTGFWCVALAGEGTTQIHTMTYRKKMLFVMGSEGSGVRPLIRKNCDDVVRIPIHSEMESLNVSNAAAVTLYAYYVSQMAVP